MKKGSTISLTCTVNVHSNPPGSVLWYHGPSVVDFDSPRGGISLETERTEKGTTSKLLVTRAELSDSGNYTCVPSNAHPASVGVHVLNGECQRLRWTWRCSQFYFLSPLDSQAIGILRYSYIISRSTLARKTCSYNHGIFELFSWQCSLSY